MRHRKRSHALGAALAAPLLTAGIVALLAGLVPGCRRAGESGAGADAAAERGPLRTIGGLRVLVLDGTPREQGFTHGYFLAPEIMAVGEHYIRAMPEISDPARRDLLARTALLLFRRPARYQEELEGLLEGMRARLGEEGLYAPILGRKITVDDLWVLNTSPDWGDGLCSSFSAWGGLTEGGAVVTGRNLDSLGREVSDRSAVVFVRRPSEPGRRPWVSLGFVGTLGCYSGMNADGVVLLLHSSDSTGRGLPPYYPLALALRECLETVSPEGDAAANAAAILSKHHVFAGTNIQISAPGGPPAVAEYDGNRRRESGVTLRRAPAGQDWLACTNNFQSRAAPSYDCWRYRALSGELTALEAAGRRVGVPDEAWRIIGLAGVETTLHTAVFLPARRRLWVAHAMPTEPAHRRRPVELDLRQLLRLDARWERPAVSPK